MPLLKGGCHWTLPDDSRLRSQQVFNLAPAPRQQQNRWRLPEVVTLPNQLAR
jgi:hypothetical protein